MSQVVDLSPPHHEEEPSAPASHRAKNVTVETRVRRRVTGLTMVAPILDVVLVFMRSPAIWTFVL